MPTENATFSADRKRLGNGRFDARFDDEGLLDVVAELARRARPEAPELVSQPVWDRALAASEYKDSAPSARGACMRLNRHGRELTWKQVVAMALKPGRARQQSLVASSRARESRDLTDHQVFYAVRRVARHLGSMPETPDGYDRACGAVVDTDRRRHVHGVGESERLPTCNQLTSVARAGRARGPNYWNDVLIIAGYDVAPTVAPGQESEDATNTPAQADVSATGAGDDAAGDAKPHQRVEWALLHFVRWNGKWPSGNALRAFCRACNYKLGTYTQPFPDYFPAAQELMEAEGVAIPTETLRSVGGRGNRAAFEYPPEGIPGAETTRDLWTRETVIAALQEFDRTTPSSKSRSQGTYRGCKGSRQDWPSVHTVINHGGWTQLMDEAKARNRRTP